MKKIKKEKKNTHRNIEGYDSSTSKKEFIGKESVSIV